MLASEVVSFVDHLHEVDSVREQVIERAASEDAATLVRAAGPVLDLGAVSLAVELVGQFDHRNHFEVALVNLPDELGFPFVDDQLAVVDLVTERHRPAHGSDAVAGTINIILKKDFEGVDIDVQDGFSSRGDAPDRRIRFLAGKNFAGGRGNISIGGEYDKSKGLFFTDRSQTAFDNRFDAPASGAGPQAIYRDLRVPSADSSGIPMVSDFLVLSPQQAGLFLGDPTATVGITNAAGATLRFGPDGTLIPIDFGSTVGDANGFSVFTSGGNGYTLRSVENLLTDLERYSVNTNLSYDLTDDIHFFGEGWYSVSKGRNLASQPVYNSALFDSAGNRDGNLIIKLNNPFLSPAARAAIQNSIATNPFSDSPTQDYF